MKITVFQKKVLKELIELAKKRETITYGKLSELMGNKDRCPRYLASVLGGLSEYTYDQLGIFLSALVINKDEMSPGAGFINLVNSFFDGNVDNHFTQRHIKCIYALNHSELDKLLIVSTR